MTTLIKTDFVQTIKAYTLIYCIKYYNDNCWVVKDTADYLILLKIPLTAEIAKTSKRICWLLFYINNNKKQSMKYKL